MTWFAARNISLSTVPVSSVDIWTVLIDPQTLASLTPLVRSIESSGEDWTWTLNGIDGLGLKIEAVFTEQMEFTEERRIDFTHRPPPGARERAAVAGVYELAPADDATELYVDLTLSVDLPLPRLSRIAVERIMHTTMRATGKQFASNLYERLDLDPADISITELTSPRR